MGQCTIVALFAHDDANAVLTTRLRSIRFTIDTPQTVANLIDAAWAANSTPANAVLGVALDGTGRLYVSSSVIVSEATQTTNTAVDQFQSDSVGSTVLDTNSHRGDAQSCSTLTGNGESFAGASMHGGYSISWCPTCNGQQQGAIESVLWGNRADGNTHCY